MTAAGTDYTSIRYDERIERRLDGQPLEKLRAEHVTAEMLDPVTYIALFWDEA